MKIEEGQTYTFKLNSGEELITKVIKVDEEHGELVINEPVSVAPGPQGMGLVPSVFTGNPKSEYRLNTNSVALYVKTDDTVKDKYLEATTGIKLPEKKLVLG